MVRKAVFTLFSALFLLLLSAPAQAQSVEIASDIKEKKVTYSVNDIQAEPYEARIEILAKRDQGVISAKADHTTNTLVVVYDANATNQKKILEQFQYTDWKFEIKKVEDHLPQE